MVLWIVTIIICIILFPIAVSNEVKGRKKRASKRADDLNLDNPFK